MARGRAVVDWAMATALLLATMGGNAAAGAQGAGRQAGGQVPRLAAEAEAWAESAEPSVDGLEQMENGVDCGGTAWSIGRPGLWVTAAHVVTGCGAKPYFLCPFGTDQGCAPAHVLQVFKQWDLAFLEVPGMERPPLELYWPGEVPVGTPVATLDDRQVTLAGPARVLWGRFVGFQELENLGAFVPAHSYDAPTIALTAYAGMSGSPVFGPGGSVIGLVTDTGDGQTNLVSTASIQGALGPLLLSGAKGYD